MKTKMTIAVMAAISALALAANAQDNTPPSDSQPPSQHAGAHGGGRGGFHVLPPPLMQQLKLTDEQKTQIAALEAETKAKLEKNSDSRPTDAAEELPPADARRNGRPATRQ